MRVHEPGAHVQTQQVLVCLNCSGIHRRLGVHISKVKSITLDGWKIKWAQWMKARGAPVPRGKEGPYAPKPRAS